MPPLEGRVWCASPGGECLGGSGVPPPPPPPSPPPPPPPHPPKGLVCPPQEVQVWCAGGEGLVCLLVCPPVQMCFLFVIIVILFTRGVVLVNTELSPSCLHAQLHAAMFGGKNGEFVFESKARLVPKVLLLILRDEYVIKWT